MKKVNYNIIVFVCSVILIFTGWFSVAFLEKIKDAVVDFCEKPNFSQFVTNIDDASKQLSYKGVLIDISSYANYLSNTRIVEKSDTTIVRLDNGYLNFVSNGLDDETLEGMADKTYDLKIVADELKIPLIYVMAPTKSYFDSYPATSRNEFRESFNKYADLLNERGIDVVNLGKEMEKSNISMEEAFFITDHHWTPETGLWATNKICEYLYENYGFVYDSKILEFSNYGVEIYQDIFLGSQGKKVGQYFTPLGLDDISLLTPKFDTSLTVTDVKGTRSGKFEETIVNKSYFNTKNLYYSNPYVAYSGGDFPLQVIKNHLEDNDGEKILLLRDSYACVVAPFLSLTTESLHTIDVRHWTGTENAKTVIDYIRLEKPDYIVILYSDLIPTLLNFNN